MARPRFIAGEATKAPWPNVKGELCHEYDDRGNHRITLNGAAGDWVSFGDIATLRLKDGKYVEFGGDRLFGATTDSYQGVLDELFEIQVIVPRSLRDVYREDGDGG